MDVHGAPCMRKRTSCVCCDTQRREPGGAGTWATPWTCVWPLVQDPPCPPARTAEEGKEIGWNFQNSYLSLEMEM